MLFQLLIVSVERNDNRLRNYSPNQTAFTILLGAKFFFAECEKQKNQQQQWQQRKRPNETQQNTLDWTQQRLGERTSERMNEKSKQTEWTKVNNNWKVFVCFL